jgi:hypothetical protein
MHELSDSELFAALHYARSIDEQQGRQILEQFQADQPALANTIFGIFPAVIAQKNQDLSYFFMDLCFDIICVFAHAFGTLPPQSGLDITWLEKQVSMMGTELQAVLKNQTMDAQIQKKLQDRLIEREKENPAHVKLTQFLNTAIDEYASECPSRTEATQMTQRITQAVIRLMNSVYSHTLNITH